MAGCQIGESSTANKPVHSCCTRGFQPAAVGPQEAASFEETPELVIFESVTPFTLSTLK